METCHITCRIEPILSINFTCSRSEYWLCAFKHCGRTDGQTNKYDRARPLTETLGIKACAGPQFTTRNGVEMAM
jgi:hypothetical protein